MGSVAEEKGVTDRRRPGRPPALMLLLAAVLAIGFGAATSTRAASGPTATMPRPVTHVEWCDTATCVDPGEGSEWEVTVFRPLELDDGPVESAPSMRLVGVALAIEAKGRSPVNVAYACFKLRDAQGNLYGHESSPGRTVPQLLHMTVEPGQTVREFVVWEIPDSAIIVACECDTGYGYGDPVVNWAE